MKSIASKNHHRRGEDSALNRRRPKAAYLGGEGEFLLSGEIHYFRTPPSTWERHLDALGECGCTAVSTYIPWSWHQPRPDRPPDFDGLADPARNIRRFLSLAIERGLRLILKPGPYVMAELAGEGIPGWLSRGHEGELARDSAGELWGRSYFSLASDYFRSAAAEWLQKVAAEVLVPLVRGRRRSLVGIQLCNEIGIFAWLRGEGDYSAPALAAWHDFLRRRFGSIENFRKTISLNAGSFDEVPAPSGPCRDRTAYRLYVIWHEFVRWLYGDYTNFVAGCLEQAGIRGVPFIVNIGGWVQGRAYDVLVNASFHATSLENLGGLVLGIDHIPEAVGSLNLPDGYAATAVVAALQSDGLPVFSSEMQCGSREHGVVTYGKELALFYRQAVMSGLSGMNFYMFSQGRNHRGQGSDGRTFYWYTAVDSRARPAEMFSHCRGLGEWLRYNAGPLAGTERPVDFAVAYYLPHHAVEFVRPRLSRREALDACAVGITDPTLFRDEFLFDCVLRVATQSNFLWSFVRLDPHYPQKLSGEKMVVLPGYDTMDAAAQCLLLEFVRSGGRLLVLGWLPRWDLLLRPCTVLAEGLGIRVGEQRGPDRVRSAGISDLPVTMSRPLAVSGRCRVTATGRGGDVVGIQKQCGRGRVGVLSCMFRYVSDDHAALVRQHIAGLLPQRPPVAVAGDLQADFRCSPDASYLLVGNVHREPRSARIRVRISDRPRKYVDLGEIELEGSGGRILPIALRLTDELRLVYATAELVRVDATRDRVVMVFRGSWPSPLVFSVESRRVPRAEAHGQPVPLERAGTRWILRLPATEEDTAVTVWLAPRRRLTGSAGARGKQAVWRRKTGAGRRTSSSGQRTSPWGGGSVDARLPE